VHRLEAHFSWTNVVLTADDLAGIECPAAEILIEGERYPEQL